ncbi:MAG: hypothetical protein II859_13025 [Bacteroidales bacterium]|nr:hypothetical protein [Bacteroidales bacterium]
MNKDFIKDFIKDFVKESQAQVSERQKKILFMIADNETLTSQKIAQKTSISGGDEQKHSEYRYGRSRTHQLAKTAHRYHHKG